MSKTIAVLLVFALLLSACQPSTPVVTATNTPETKVPTATPSPTLTPTPTATSTPIPTSTPEPTATPLPQDLGPGEYPASINPLTGLTVDNPQLLNRRPLAIKIQIFPRGQRPPWGISQADIVFDFYQNFGMTRLHAIFYGNNPAKVGPIRSARLLDGTLVQSYQSVFAFGGADYRILSSLQSKFGIGSRLVLEGSNSCPALCREDPNGYNYLVASPVVFDSYLAEKDIDNSRPDLSGMSFQYTPPEEGAAQGTDVSVRYSISAYARWSYDPEQGLYLRSQDVQEATTRESEVYAPFIDRENGAQVSAANVVFLFAPHTTAFGTLPGPKEIIDIQLNGSGKAFALRDGKVYADLLWNRQPGSVITLTTADGKPFPFKHGPTWFQVVGQYSSIEEAGTGTWRIEHRTP